MACGTATNRTRTKARLRKTKEIFRTLEENDIDLGTLVFGSVVEF
jgi:hypothetical protein